ncbi:YhcN/YlaJ family sporulation lipoprotein [Aciduricibacillus chroicocephali]|uniref:YhcN/YlaJ family sporulation lipoprotein n=1 Tax=Aciduricibacillus chroicocephali TaxID=3054939 RepID=A0ABY9KW81_9BACI|nr:YhcN/YlaJ family sporulation lipoprotein [Bacillaceae bacterium 44XB]
MLKKRIGFLLAFSLLAGCSNNNAGKNQMENAAELDAIPHHDEARNAEFNRDNRNTGFVRYKEEDLRRINKPSGINREEAAQSVSSLILQNGGYDEVAVLVTDREVLIGYKKQDKLSQERAADMAIKTARSAVPAFYRIYATDDPTMMNDIESLHNSKTNHNIRSSVDRIIDEMEHGGTNK